jgi:methylglutaconyl-CoA hydratase
VILTANGRNFCAGGDLNWMKRMAKYSHEKNLADAQQLAALMYKLNTLNKPTIALVHGAAYGGGAGIIACCDIAIATNDANFCFSEVKLGLIPSVISPYVIAAIGERAARRYFLTAENFNAQEAHRLGLIHMVVHAEELNIIKEKIIKHLLQNSPNAIIAAKQGIQLVVHKPINSELIDETAKQIADIRVSPEGQEGLSAFLEKRSPKWLQKNIK